MIMKYRRKPTTIEAIKWTGENLSEIKRFVGDSLLVYEDDIYIKFFRDSFCIVPIGQYIIKLTDGSFYIFGEGTLEENYEVCEEK